MYGWRAQAGFTLLELVIVLAVIGLLMSLTPALLPNLREATETKQTAETLASDLRELHGLAISRSMETQLALGLADGSYGAQPLGRRRQLPAQMALSFDGPPQEVSGDQAWVRFYPDGSSSGGVIRLSRGDHARRITIYWLTGKVSVDG